MANKQSLSIENARKILGNRVKHLSDLEVQQIVSSFQYIVDAWLDNEERLVFNGSTINELVLTDQL